MAASEGFSRPSVTSTCACSTAALPHTIAMANIAGSAAIRHTTWPLDWSGTQLFSTFVRYPRLLALLICDFVPPKHARSVLLPPRFSSLIDTVASSQLVLDVRATIGSRQPLFSFTDCWQQTSSIWVDVSVLPACQHPSSARLYYPATLEIIQLNFYSVLGLPLTRSDHPHTRES